MVFELPPKSPGSMLSAALLADRQGRRISLASTRRSCLRFAERSGDKPFGICTSSKGSKWRTLFERKCISAARFLANACSTKVLKDESPLKLRRCRNKRSGTTPGNPAAVWNLSGTQMGKLTRLSDYDPEPLNGMLIATEVSNAPTLRTWRTPTRIPLASSGSGQAGRTRGEFGKLRRSVGSKRV